MKPKIMILVVLVLLVFAKDGLTSEEYNGGEEFQLIKVGNEFCPVSGKKNGGMGPAVEYEYNGKIYSFCCAGCIGAFKADPEKYVKLVKERIQEKQSTEFNEQMQREDGKPLQEDSMIREYEVFGMDCPGCHQGLEKLVKKISSVQESQANWKKKSLVVTIRPGESLNDDDIYDAIKRANFTVGKRIK